MPRLPASSFPTGAVGSVAGVQQVIPVAAPAPATDFLYTLPAGYVYRLITCSFRFAASAVVGSRFHGFTYTDGTNILWSSITAASTAASQTTRVSFGNRAEGTFTTGGGGAVGVGIPTPWLPQGYTIGSRQSGLQAGDQIDQIILWLECLDNSHGDREHGRGDYAGGSVNPTEHTIGG